jgi:hypothetical protein
VIADHNNYKEKITMKRYRIMPFVFAVLLLGTATVGSAAEKAGIAFVEPGARKALRIVNDYLKTAENFTVHIESVSDEIMEGGQRIQRAAIQDIAVRRPNRVKIRSVGDRGEVRLWYDGRRISILDILDFNIDPDEVLGDNMTYSWVEVPDTIDAAFDFVDEEYSIAPPLIALARDNPLGNLNELATSGFYVGLHHVGDVKCHHLAYTTEGMDVQLWIENGLFPLLRKVVITYRDEPGSPQFTAYLTDWDFSPHLPDSVFKFFKPKSALLVPLEKAGAKSEGEK